MRPSRVSFPVLVSAWVHVGVLVALCALVGSPVAIAERGGNGPADMGGEDFGAVAEAVEDDLDFGEPQFHITSIGVVLDAQPVAVIADSAPVDAKPALAESAPVAAAPLVKKAPKVEAKPAEKAELARTSTASPSSSEPTETTEVAEATSVTELHFHNGKKGRKASGKGKKEPCPVVENDGVEKLADQEWAVERHVAEYYAGHIKELQKIVSVRLVKNEEGKADGFRVGVPRCSVLREGGLRSGDVVKDVNGIHVHDLFSAIGAYFKLRREDTIVLNVVRKGQPMVLRYQMV